MTASLETLVVAAYVFADSLPIPRSGPAGKASDAELIALAVAQAILGIPSDRQFLGVIERLLPGWFPALPGQSQLNRRLRRLTPQITAAQMMLAELAAEGRVRLVDGTLIDCANYPGCAQRSGFAGHAAYGRCPSKSRFVWGMRLVLFCDPRGVPVGYDLVGPKTGEERECALRLAAGQAGALLFADGVLGQGVPLLDGGDRHRAGHSRSPPPRRAPGGGGGQGADPPRDRVGLLDPEAPDAP